MGLSLLLYVSTYLIMVFKDCEGGGCHKAFTAAESLRLIFPGVNAKGVDLCIPMPGHSIGEDGNFKYNIANNQWCHCV